MNSDSRTQRFAVRAKDFSLDCIAAQNVAVIVPRKSNLDMTIDHQQPSFVGEWYPIKLSICNKEKHRIRDVTIEVSLLDDEFADLSKIFLLSSELSNICVKGVNRGQTFNTRFSYMYEYRNI